MKLWTVVFIGLVASVSAQQQTDFDLRMTECKTTLGYVGPSEEALTTVEGDTSEFACRRVGEQIYCNVKVAGGPSIKGPTANYRIGLDLPPSLYFGSADGSDFFAVDLTNRRVVSISRYVSDTGEIVGSKVCRGVFSQPARDWSPPPEPRAYGTSSRCAFVFEAA